MPALEEFRFPVRDADIWAPDEWGNPREQDDIEADLDSNQRAVEDFLSNTLPTVYIQQAEVGSGTIDPAQLATGTAGSGKAPVSQGASAPAWTDIATQAELDAHSTAITAYIAQTAAGTYTSQDIQRGLISTGAHIGNTGTNTTVTQTYSVAYGATPRVTASVECQAGTALFHTLTAVTATGLTVKVTALSAVGATTTFFVHWHAIKA